MNNKNLKDIWWNPNNILSRNAMLNFILGPRGCGKSYGAKKFVTNRFITKGEQFVYVRRFKTELSNAMLKGKTPIFFNQVASEFEGHKLTNTKDTFIVDDKIAGWAIPLSTASIQKSATFEGVKTIIFDEFIIDKGNLHYLNNEVEAMLDLLETIARLRDVRVFFLANSITIANPYFIYFDLTLPYNSNFKMFKNGNICVEYIENLKYSETKKKTKFGQIVEGTNYGSYAIDNTFLRDNHFFIEKKPGTARHFFNLILEDHTIGIWRDFSEMKMYISNDYNPNCRFNFAINNTNHSDTTVLVKPRENPFIRCVINYYKEGSLCFENQKIKGLFLDKMLNYIV